METASIFQRWASIGTADMAEGAREGVGGVADDDRVHEARKAGLGRARRGQDLSVKLTEHLGYCAHIIWARLFLIIIF